MMIFVKIKDKIKQHSSLIMFVIALAAYYFLLGCPMRVWFGIACPGCGMSRALEAALRLDFQLAYECHPLVFFLPLAGIVILLRKKIPQNVMGVLVIITGIVMFAVYIYRLCTGSDIVYIDFTRGRIYQIVQMIIQFFSSR